MNEEIKGYLEKSEHALRVAEKLLNDEFYADAASKAYYSMFYAAQALLKFKGIHVIKHSAVESALGYHYVRTGKIPQRFHRMLIDARTIREMADYEINEEVILSHATETIQNARLFFEEIKHYIYHGLN